MTTPTRLGAPGARPMTQAAPNGGVPASSASMTLGTLREVRNELASLGDMLERMSKEMAGLRRAVEAVANREPREAAPDPDAARAGRTSRKRAEAAAADREAALEARVAKLERRVAKIKRQVAWAA